MSTDPKKLVRTIIFAYFMASMFLLAGMQMTFSIIPVAIFTGLALLLYLTGCFSLYQQYKKYHIHMYLFLIFVGIALSIFGVIIAVASQI